MTMQSVAPRRRPVASNTLYTFMDIGNFLGPTLAGTILGLTNYETMLRSVLVPLGLAVAIFIIGWKPYTRNRAKAQAEMEQR